MKYMVNCSLRPEKSREAFAALINDGPAHESWELLQKHVVVEFAFKVGNVPGFVMLMECHSEEETRSYIEVMPAVRDGWVDYQIDPISAVAKFGAGRSDGDALDGRILFGRDGTADHRDNVE